MSANFIRRILVGIAACALLFPAFSRAARGRNWLWRHRRRAASAPAAARHKAGPRERPSSRPRATAGPFRAGRWSREARKALEDVMREYGRKGRRYDPLKPPVAVLSWDGTAIFGDSAEGVFRNLVDSAAFKFSDEFWKVVPIVYGRQIIRWDYERFHAMPRSIWSLEPSYMDYRKKLIASYYDMCRKQSRKECRIYLARLLAGFDEDGIKAAALAAVREEMRAPLLPRFVRDSPADRSPVREETGLREIPEIKDLCRALQDAGFQVWVIAAESEWVLRALVPDYGIDPHRAVGIDLEVKGGQLTTRVLEPVPFRYGKVAAIEGRIGRRPVLAVGSGVSDMEMLSRATALSLLIDRGDARLRREALKRGWTVQKAFLVP